MCVKLILFAILAYGKLSLMAAGEPVEDKETLLDFIRNIRPSRNLNWDRRTSACHRWTGVTCNHDNSRVIAVRLHDIGFKNKIPTNTLSRLSALQELSLRSNSIPGPFPSDLLKLENLMGLFLQFNKFQGPLPRDFFVWTNLTMLNLSSNAFHGGIPSSISNLTRLTVLNLANNSLSGCVPDLDIPGLEMLDLSNNRLTGTVPQSLLRFPSSAFSANNVSLRDPLAPVPSQTVEPKKSKCSDFVIFVIVFGCCIVLCFSIGLSMIAINIKKKKNDDRSSNARKDKPKRWMDSVDQDEIGKMSFFEGCDILFDLEDLLMGSAKLLGKGSFGTTYKVALEDATSFAVKRLKEVAAGRKEFEQLMEMVGNIRHDNVAPLRAYYYSKDEKLMVYDYYSHGSMSDLLHAKRGENRIPLDWEARLRIAIGAAKGVAYIHSQGGGKLVHGNVKASNIFTNSQLCGCVSDLGLAALTPHIAPSGKRTAGYRAPEVTPTSKVSQASDVYSFGVVLLELLTGKSPVCASGGEEVGHLVRWVRSVVYEEWSGEVFDIGLLRYPNIEEEMAAMMQIGLSCVARVPEHRPRMGDVVKILEGIGPANAGRSPYAETRSIGSVPTPNPHVGEIGSSSVPG